MNPATASALQLQESPTEQHFISLAAGEEVISDSSVTLGSSPFLVAPGFHDTLFSPIPIIESGGELRLNSSGGVLTSNNQSTLNIYKHGPQFRVKLTDIEQFDSAGSTATTVIAREATATTTSEPSWHQRKRRSQRERRLQAKTPMSSIVTPPSVPVTPLPDRSTTQPNPIAVKRKQVRWDDDVKVMEEQLRSSPEQEVNQSSNHSTIELPPTRRKSTLTDPISPYETLQSRRIRKATGSDVMLRYIEAHERCGHQHPTVMQRAVLHKSWINLGLTAGQIYRASKLYTCPMCTLAKRHLCKLPINTTNLPSQGSRKRSKLTADNSKEVSHDNFKEVSALSATSMTGDASSTSKDAPMSTSTDTSIPQPVHLSSHTALPGQIISMDPSGLINPPTPEHRPLFFLFKDVCTGMNHAVISHHANIDYAKEAVNHVFEWYNQQGCHPKYLRVDAASTFTSDTFTKWLWTEHKCQVQHSVPYAHWQNAVERDMQTVVDGASALLHSQKWLHANNWDLALHHFINIRNRTPNSHNTALSPWQIFKKEPLDFDVLFRFTFGDLVAVADDRYGRARRKFDMRNQLGIYVGEAERTKRASLVYWPSLHRTTERFFLWKLDITDNQYLHYLTNRLSTTSEGSIQYASITNAMYDFSKAVENDPVALRRWENTLLPLEESLDAPEEENSDDESFESSTVTGLRDHPSDDSTSTSPHHSPSPSPSIIPNSTSKSPPPTSSRILRSHGKKLETAHRVVVSQSSGDYVDSYGTYQFMNPIFAAAAKVTVGKALKSAQQQEWKDAMIEEMNSLLTGGTLQPISEEEYLLLSNPRTIHSTMQLKHKERNKEHKVLHDKYKARLCACGNELYSSISETYSPTIGALAYATVHQLAIIDRMHKCSIDVVGAYLHQDYPEDAPPLCITLPPNVAQLINFQPNQRFRIRKYIYGLPDAGRAYYKAYSAHLIACGYKRSTSDPCLFTKLDDKDRTYIWCHVDDTFVCSTNKSELRTFQRAVASKFKITIDNDVNDYLGIAITQQGNGDVILTQPKLLQSLFTEYEDELAKYEKRIATSPQRPKEFQSTDATPIPQTEYLHLLGALIYLTKSRPDIATAVSFAATFSAHPTRGAYLELLHCLRYLRDTRTQGLRILGGLPGRALQLRCYVDASYLTHSDSKSHTGYCLSLGTIGSFYSKSGKQPLMATSSTYAELRALYSLTVDIMYVIHLMNELGRPLELPCIILEDNQPVIDITKDLSSRTNKCKHFLMLVHYIREQIHAGFIALQKVHTTDNIADVLTKIVTGTEFSSKAALLLGVPSE